jgi:hypothetical protein
MKPFFGQISLPSQQKNLLKKYRSTLSSQVIPVKTLAVPESERVWEGIKEKCGDTQGQCLMDAMLPPLSEKTSEDTSRLDSTQSSAIWQRMVTALTQEFKALKLWDSLILGSEYFLSRSRPIFGNGESGSLMNSSKPVETQTDSTNFATPQARDWKGPQGRSFKGTAMDLPAMTEKGWSETKLESHAVKEEMKEQARAGQLEIMFDYEETPPNMYPTPRVADKAGSLQNPAEMTSGGFRTTRERSGLTFGAMLSQAVSAIEEKKWSTPCVGDQTDENLERWEERQERKKKEGINLHEKLDIQVKKIEREQTTPSPSPNSTMKDTHPQSMEKTEDHTSNSEMWGTPNTMDHLPSRSYEAMKETAQNGGRKNRSKPSNLREQIDPLMCQAYVDAKKEASEKKWGTPNTMDYLPPKEGEALERNKKKGGCKNLREDVNSIQLEHQHDPDRIDMTGKSPEPKKQVLNPSWVEGLMMLPTGYTLIKSDKIELDCAEMESYG